MGKLTSCTSRKLIRTPLQNLKTQFIHGYFTRLRRVCTDLCKLALISKNQSTHVTAFSSMFGFPCISLNEHLTSHSFTAKSKHSEHVLI